MTTQEVLNALAEYERAERAWGEAFDAHAPADVVTALHKRAMEAWARYCALRDAR